LKIITQLRSIFGKREKKLSIILLFLMVVSAFLETIGIGLIVPFIGVVTEPDSIYQNEVLARIYDVLGLHSTQSFIFLAAIGLLVVFLVKNIYLFLFHRVQYKMIFDEQVRLTEKLFKSYLSMPYTFHLQRNTAQLTRNINIEVQNVFFLITSLFLFVTELLVIVSICLLLLILSPIATILSGTLLGFSIWVFFAFFKTKISTAGIERQQAQGEMLKWVNQGLGAGKELKVLKVEDFFLSNFNRESKKFASAARFHLLINQVPRLYIETIVIATILTLVLVTMLRYDGLATLLSTIALFTMAAFRLMPSMNRLMYALSIIRQYQSSLDVVFEDLAMNKMDPHTDDRKREPFLSDEDLSEKAFVDSIQLNGIVYRYPGSNVDALQNVSLEIPIGRSIAFKGASGSGKTTLIDLILGILTPAEGSIVIDNQDIRSIKDLWQGRIGYVPQQVFLTDDSVRANIAFGINESEIDDERVWSVLEQVELKELVENLPDGLHTILGEQGTRLSGGQRQRVGIARALFRNPEILVLDESTSALDYETETEIMKAVDGLRGEKTLLIIAHRLSTIEKCDIVFTLSNGRVIDSTYQRENCEL
jgi:ATP-binding cassette, subfamily B, bacterial PglK